MNTLKSDAEEILSKGSIKSQKKGIKTPLTNEALINPQFSLTTALSSKNLKFMTGQNDFFEDRFRNICSKYQRAKDEKRYAKLNYGKYSPKAPIKKKINEYLKYSTNTVKKKPQSSAIFPLTIENEFAVDGERYKTHLEMYINNQKLKSVLADEVDVKCKEEFNRKTEVRTPSTDRKSPFLLYNHFKIKNKNCNI